MSLHRNESVESGGPGPADRPDATGDLAELLPDADYDFPMRFQRGRVADFFGSSTGSNALLSERSRWLAHDPAECLALLPEGNTLLEEMAAVFRSSGMTIRGIDRRAPDHASQLLHVMGESFEPDFLLLKHSQDNGPRLVAGCVCFPSSWSLKEKIGRPVEWIHGVVPGLNEQLGTRIGTFLRRMAPGTAWLRANWGLSRSAELNQHPNRALPRLDATVGLNEVWLRVERQALVALPETAGVLFGIRIAVYPLAGVIKNSAAARGLERALRTMSEEMARYKNLASARASILKILEE
jgi:hypothetical protein